VFSSRCTRKAEGKRPVSKIYHELCAYTAPWESARRNLGRLPIVRQPKRDTDQARLRQGSTYKSRSDEANQNRVVGEAICEVLQSSPRLAWRGQKRAVTSVGHLWREKELLIKQHLALQPPFSSICPCTPPKKTPSKEARDDQTTSTGMDTEQ